MTAILGISAFYHDAAAVLVVDGQIVAAAQEERFSRVKHDSSFPSRAIAYCLEAGGLDADELDYVGFYEKPLPKFERLIETYLAFAPFGYRSFRLAIPKWLRQKFHISREIRNGLQGRNRSRIVFTEHHESHAASAFFPSPFAEAAILTLDGVGEWSTCCIGIGRGNKIQILDELRFPHSLGLLYSAFTYYCGFRVNSGEYKLMGLAPYGQPIYREQILQQLIDVKEDGSFRMDMSYFNYCQGLTMTSPKFHRLFGGPPRRPESEITQRNADLAASIQAVTDEIILRMSRHVHRKTGMNNLVLAGGVALNCVSNGRILREGPFEDIWIQPAAGDAGGALGNALFIWHQLLERPRVVLQPGRDNQHGSFLGPEFSDETIRRVLEQHATVFTTCDSDDELCERIADLIAQGNVVGWFQGRMEYGPRSLGNRTILADARDERMQSVLNQKIKFRESFRPFAPIVLRECVDQYFEMRPNQDSPYMLLVAPVRKEIRVPVTNAASTGLDRLSARRSSIPAVTHVDYSSRVQTVDRERHPLLHQLLSRFHAQTDCPVMINTSFNIRGEPIVCTPEEALRCFLMTDMDALVLGRHVLLKSDQKQQAAPERDSYLAQFQLD